MPTLYLLCGVAFSGKTTLGEAIARHAGLRVVSTEEINEVRGLRGGEGIPYQEWEATHAIAVSWLGRLMGSGEDLLVDDTNCFRWIRDRFRWVAERHGYRPRVIFLDVPLEVLHQRRRANQLTGDRHRVVDPIFDSHAADFEPPSEDEDVITFDPDQDLGQWLLVQFGRNR